MTISCSMVRISIFKTNASGEVPMVESCNVHMVYVIMILCQHIVSSEPFSADLDGCSKSQVLLPCDDIKRKEYAYFNE